MFYQNVLFESIIPYMGLIGVIVYYSVSNIAIKVVFKKLAYFFEFRIFWTYATSTSVVLSMSVSDRQQIKQPFKKLRWKITFTYWLFLVKSKFQATPISPKSTWSQFWPVKHSVHPFSRGSLFLNPKRLPPRSYSDGQIWLYSVRFGRTWSMAFSTRGLDTIQSDKKLGCYNSTTVQL